ncbi:MAG: 1-deoxy-D-xylulose-5-phosphate reductoisomerase [Leptospiraceae bacterium]|nr:1-deoxy-D-xylulose-5-phosphate reductoisomerase [Leptospiraceae bacterium]MDW8306257.1 1-deoxy-D-xylulose-5-phosphate reductoisomerase [Leptospiraceae bacterium]
MAKKIIILGATGSVGECALKIISQFPDRFHLVAFSYHKNHEKAQKIAREFNVKYVACTGDQAPKILGDAIHCLPQMEGLLEEEYDLLLNAVVGAAGVRATYKALEQKKTILLANKESLVVGGELFLSKGFSLQDLILPVDSEHSSLFRLLKKNNSFRSLTITASGGPFRHSSEEEIKNASLQAVLRHPTWEMGAKITVDSAGMINKALEIMEAHYLFSVPYKSLSAVVHPQSYVHAIVELHDGTYIFHASEPDMLYPVSYALFYPEEPPFLRPRRNIAELGTLEFLPVDKRRYPGFYLGLEAAQKGGYYPALFNAANEEAVSLFLDGKIRFYEIPHYVEKTLEEAPLRYDGMDVETLFEIDSWARHKVRELLKR